jgi:hypothetical protein
MSIMWDEVMQLISCIFAYSSIYAARVPVCDYALPHPGVSCAEVNSTAAELTHATGI